MTTDQLSALLAQDPAAVLEHDRRLYEQQIVRAADLIAAHAQERPAVLLAGPSGSGKTTTALLIERELDRRGMETHTLSMDDYFCPLTERELELFSRNELDLERPSRVDVPFFQEQLGKLLAGEEVELPHYDFKNSVRVFDGRTLRRRPGELVILEGIHALNPEVTGYDGRTTRIYVSVRTRITPRSGQGRCALHRPRSTGPRRPRPARAPPPGCSSPLRARPGSAHCIPAPSPLPFFP